MVGPAGFALSDGSQTQFSSPLQQLLPLDSSSWEPDLGLDFEFPLFPTDPVTGQYNTHAPSIAGQHRPESNQRRQPVASVTFNDFTAMDSHSAFFSDDLSFAPMGAGYTNDMVDKNDMNNVTSDIEALLQEMSQGPSKSVVSSIPSPTINPQTSSSTSVSKLASPTKSPQPAPTRVNKEFHFVANSDKAGAARVRNTMASRKHRQSKVNRIAELEKLLAEAEEERDMWKQRALTMGGSC